ncbi:hypothetical protein PCS_01778 [Desulfocurvibacter africanus PCS]|uniref:Thioesterase domain-containing protein n=1 Tax=Desulfocurvibacter africanus PCS TaxID=1262666 RepID=M5PT12_DESAF|nr:hotdog fold thioesterase [Desulfocurvibacter africanus]EMG37487.1 hypothetical protein PCS_01778 [Desulfocurvibacter africanus PCS]
MNAQEMESFRDLIENQLPFNKFIGIKLLSLEAGTCKLYIPYKDELIGDTRRGALHGGVISTLIDTCGGFAVWSMCDITDRLSTIDMRVDYLKPAFGDDLVAESQVKLLGNRVGNASTVLYSRNNPGVILAEGRSVYNIRRGEPTGAGASA